MVDSSVVVTNFDQYQFSDLRLGMKWRRTNVLEPIQLTGEILSQNGRYYPRLISKTEYNSNVPKLLFYFLFRSLPPSSGQRVCVGPLPKTTVNNVERHFNSV